MPTTLKADRHAFGYGDFLDILRGFGVAQRSGETHFVVDISEPGFFYLEGMAPLVAIVRSLVSRGNRIQIALPSDRDMTEYFATVGWTAALTGVEPPGVRSGSTYIPIRSYDSHEDLNRLVNEALNLISEQAVLPEGVRGAVDWCLNEVADNVLNHASTAEPGWLQATTYPQKKQVAFVVADTGRGILASLRESFPELTDAEDAVHKAIQKGITRSRDVGQGNGLAGLIRIAQGARGRVKIHSGGGSLDLDDQGQLHSSKIVSYPGTLVCVTLPTDKPVDLNEALWGQADAPAFDFNYLTDDGIRVVVLNEAENFGNRFTARRIRNKVANLMKEHPTELVVLDFAGVDTATASFCDELVGKLAIELGIATFFGKCRLIGMSRFVENSVNEVLRQRVSAT
jgi:hypothetical protein